MLVITPSVFTVKQMNKHSGSTCGVAVKKISNPPGKMAQVHSIWDKHAFQLISKLDASPSPHSCFEFHFDLMNQPVNLT